ncbi:MAG: DUF123 domain-containing protein, partial [Calditrichae bacterium]|nr:DUF123 domain-containing protein [Calditrichia bacterium]NIV72698.1 DUF123 domain-containing protein [Calditrichia bacterium]
MNWYEEPDPHQKGSYVLVLYLPENQLIEIGKLGEYSFVKGIYAYVGSAFGPGGLAARIQHHLRPTNRPHWHIDYLSNIAKPEEVWLSESEIKRKHHWANILQELFASGSEFKGFGASDCRCES